MSKKIPTREELLEIEEQLKEIERRKTTCAIDFYHPYQKQQDFHDLGRTCRERLLMAGNQNGKTYCGGAEVSYHLTGLYPEWWQGRRWERPTRGWAAGVTGIGTRDNPQRILLGEIANGVGTGMIPKRCLDRDKMSLARGVSDLFDTVLVKHFGPDGKEDGWSELKFKSYETGRTKWQGATLDWIWFDEEPDMEIYSEGLTRITATDGMVFITFTPLEGMTAVVSSFLDKPTKDRQCVTMTLDDALHIPRDKQAAIVEAWPEWQREARRNGVPMLGSGKVFQVVESGIRVEPFPIPAHWRLLWGVDFGIDHPFAAVLTAWDFDADVCYVIHCVRMRDAMPLQHVEAMKPFGLDIPVAWPQDGWQRQEFGGDLKPMAAIYRKHGAKMLQHHATFVDGSNSTEAGIMDLQERMRSSRFKVFAECTEWFDEFRKYHRKEGELVKVDDDLMSATRIAAMMKRSAQAVRFYRGQPAARAPLMARDIDIDPFGP